MATSSISKKIDMPKEFLTDEEMNQMSPASSSGAPGFIADASETKPTSIIGSIFGGIKDVSHGFAKSAISHVANAASLVAQPFGGGEAVRAFADQPGLQTKNLGEDIGAGIETVGEFIAPTGLVRKAQAGVDALLAGGGFLKGAGRVLGKAGIEAGMGAGITLAQTADPKEAATTGLLFGGIKGVTGTLGESVKAMGLPEHIYSTFFKNTYRDVLSFLDTAGLKNLQKTKPEMYKSLVEQGIIKGAKGGGEVVVDKTLAREALDRGLKGSVNTMANVVIEGKYTTEKVVQDIVSKSKVKIDVSHPQYANILKDIAKEYKDVGFGKFAQQAKGLLASIKSSGGKVTARTGLEMRRFLDGFRHFTNRGGAQSPLLSIGEQNLKEVADRLRVNLKAIPGMGKAMDDYVFNIEALEHLAKLAQRQGNAQLISLMDSVFFSGAAVGNPAVGTLLGLGRRALNLPGIATRGASAIENSGLLTKTGAALKGATATGLQPLIGDQ